MTDTELQMITGQKEENSLTRGAQEKNDISSSSGLKGHLHSLMICHTGSTGRTGNDSG